MLMHKKKTCVIPILCQGLSEPKFYGHLVYKLKKIVGSNTLSAQFIKIMSIIKSLATTLIDFELKKVLLPPP